MPSGVVGVARHPRERVADREHQVRGGVALVGHGLRLGLTERGRVAEPVAGAVEGHPAHVAARIGHVGLGDLAVG